MACMRMQGMPSLNSIDRRAYSKILRAKPSAGILFLTLYSIGGEIRSPVVVWRVTARGCERLTGIPQAITNLNM